jgi:hypothetical protein
MITEKVQNLFDFINFLHSKTDYFLSKQPLVDKVLALNEKRRSLNPDNNYKDRIEYDKVQAEIEKEFSKVEKQTTNVIKEKVQLLDIADISTPIINLNAKAELFELQRNFTQEDLIIIREARKKYIDFRTKANFHYFLQFLFDELNRDLKQFFNYFKDETADYFEPFERKGVTVNSIADAIKHLQDGKAVTLPFEAFNKPHEAMAEPKQNQFLKSSKAEEEARNFCSQTSNEAFETYNRNYQKLREQFRVKRKATKEDCKTIPCLKEGDTIEYDPEYKTSVEAFALLINYYAVAYLELEKYLFIEKYKVWNESTIKAEIQEIEKFINEANKESLSDASVAFNKWGTDKPEFVYRRLKSGFYEHLEVERYPLINSIGNEEARIYGRYFLFYDFLKKKLKANSQCEPIESFDGLLQFFEKLNGTNDFEPLKKYIRENYLNVHPNKFTLERLGQIKRNISTWKLQLKDLNEAPELQEFISEVIADIDLKIGRFGTDKKETEGEFSYIKKGQKFTIEPEAAKELCAILKPFFNVEQQQDLQQLVLNGTDANGLLYFKDNGNRLADAFKQLWEHSLIIGCQKQDLETFLIGNFQYRFRDKMKTFTPDYAEKCISRNDNPCKNPLIKIEAGKVVRIEKPKRRKRNY